MFEPVTSFISRHPGESRGPLNYFLAHQAARWIPAFAGMTAEGIEENSCKEAR
jgi:hypothetical protein